MLLLVVLSLLVLFLMVGTAFVITAKQSEKAAKAANRGTLRLSAAAAKGDLLDEVLKQIVRDTNNPNSSLRFHSLLGDMYGNDGFQAQIANVSWADPVGTSANVTGGQLVQFEIDATVDLSPLNGVQSVMDLYGVPMTPEVLLSPIDNAYNGQLLTFTRAGTAASARGVSTRIVGYRPPVAGPPAQPAVLTVMRFNLADGSDLRNLPGGLTDLNGARILINGRPFNGTGFGFNQTVAAANQPRLTLAEDVAGTRRPLSLMPNSAFLDVSKVHQSATDTASPKYLLSASQLVSVGAGAGPQFTLASRIGLSGIGGSDETYDAPDFQNMALAYVPGGALADSVLDASGALPTTPALSLNGRSMILPSWHRPELVNYWNETLTSSGGLAADNNLLRKVVMRPTWVDHPRFTGSNPELSQLVAAYEVAPSPTTSDPLVNRMIYGPWDVDNDNDGFRDSVWVDVGLPVIAGPNGKLVKPLAAIMIVDMDGRLNVNAHGSCDLAEAWNSSGTGLTDMPAVGASLAKSQTSDKAPRGLGFGPADISLTAALGGLQDFRRLLVGHDFGNGVAFPGRYGFPEDTGNGNHIRPGVAGYFDVMSQVGMTGWPQQAAQMSSFGTPPDLRARYGVGVNDLGQPVFEATLQTPSPSDNLAKDSPYEINLSQKTAAGVNGVAGVSSADAPFTVAELERVLRLYDADAGALPPRLEALANVRSHLERRSLITTDSFDPPVPNFSVPQEIAGMVATAAPNARLPRTFAELLETRVRRVMFDTAQAKWFPAQLTVAAEANGVRGAMRRLLAPELANGTRFNLNRPFGNGRDDNDNGVVDEPGEFFDQNNNDQVDVVDVEYRDRNNDGDYDPGVDLKLTPMWPGFDDLNDADASTFTPPTAAANFLNAAFPEMATEIIPDGTNPNGIVRDVDHRQLFARHLYVLALTLTADEKFGIPLPDLAKEKDRLKRDREIAHRIAQWAANVVDFRDPDNIMTAFEYDVNPFNGWDVDGWPGESSPGPDGIIGTGDDIAASPDMAKPFVDDYRGLVWGTERPELVMTETLAWHDRRTDDDGNEEVYPAGTEPNITKTADPADPERDTDYDQTYRPRGALFVELYNPWPASPSANADTHDRTTSPGFDMGVRLEALGGTGVDASPVWRMAIYKGYTGDKEAVDETPKQVFARRDWDPDDPNKEPTTTTVPPGKIDRSVYFAGKASKDSQDGAAFFNDLVNPTPSVRPGRFLVVGSGDETSAGVYENPIGDRSTSPPIANKPVRRIELVTRNAPAADRAHAVRMLDAEDDPSAAVIRDPIGNFDVWAPSNAEVSLEPVPGDSLSQSITDVAIIDRIDDGAGGSTRRRLTLSEPAEGYPDKFGSSKWKEASQSYESLGAPMPIDIPLDGPIGGMDSLTFSGPTPPDWPYAYEMDQRLTEIRGDNPDLSDDPRGDSGAFYKSIFLQRLANPLLAWNPEPGHPDHKPALPVNPYLTVDMMPANLTVFNSHGDDGGREEADGDQPDDGKDANEPRRYFASVQRGLTARRNDKSPPANNFMPMMYGLEAPTLVKVQPPAQAKDMLFTEKTPAAYSGMNLKNHTHFWFDAVPYCSLGFLNRPFRATGATGVPAKVMPTKPYEWLAFHNRPFATGNEILQVPRGRTLELMRSFTNGEDQRVGGGMMPPDPPYTTAVGELDASGKPVVNPAVPKPAFAHLENFFYSPPPATPPATAAARGTVANMFRVLDYVHTPSLFVGTETWLNPGQNQFGGKIDMETPAERQAAATDPRLSFQPPFNAISEFRDPGRVNINTISGEAGGTSPTSDVWNGLFHVDDNPNRKVGDKRHAGPTWAELTNSRGGDGGAVDLQLNGQFPTMFVNPFRSPDGGNLVPLDDMRRVGVDVGLLRTMNSTKAGPTGPAPKPLFEAEPGPADTEYADPRRHQHFRYQPITRMANLVTTRSNVYAVWVTIGFFEVEPAPPWSAVNQADFGGSQAIYNKVYSGGYQLAKEDGVDTGEIRRLRGFYMVDRTMPAAFEPGVDHNVENVIRLRRRIE